MKKLSIIVPIYYNELNIPGLLERLVALKDRIHNYDFEFIFVDDGSEDASFNLLADAQLSDKRIKIIKLSKNFGSMAALQAGLNFVTGDCAGIIAADLQDPPELFQEMLKKWEGGSRVIMAHRQGRSEKPLLKACSNIYYYLLRTFALPGYPKGGFDFVLIDRQVVEELNNMAEKNTNVMNLIFWLGHKRDSVSYVRLERKHGTSRWTLTKKIKLFIDSFISFSYIPIRIISIIGIITAMISFTFGSYTAFLRLFSNVPVQGWTSIITLITMLMGLIMVMLGIIGEYLWRILDESRERPNFVIDRILIDEHESQTPEKK